MLRRSASWTSKIAELDQEIARRASEDEVARRLMTIPGIGPDDRHCHRRAGPPAGDVQPGRDFSAWLGLTPVQKSTGGKQKLGPISKMGERTLRRLLIIGAARSSSRRARGAPPGSWLEQMLARKPRMLVAVALANKMARIIWALLARSEDYRAPVAAGVSLARPEVVGGVGRSKEGMAQQSVRRDRKNQCFPPCSKHALGDLDPVRELPYGPAASRCTTGRTDGSIRLLASTSNSACA